MALHGKTIFGFGPMKCMKASCFLTAHPGGRGARPHLRLQLFQDIWHGRQPVWIHRGAQCGLMRSVRKATVHHFYSACTASQLAALSVLQRGQGWLEKAVSSYREAGYAAADRLGVSRPEGGTFLFINVADQLDERGLHGFLVDCIDRGLILAPGVLWCGLCGLRSGLLYLRATRCGGTG